MKMFMELYNSALKTVRDLALTKPRENILILADTVVDIEMLKMLASAAYSLEAEPSIMIYETREEVNVEPPKNVAEAMRNSDVIISLPLMYILHTYAYNEALKAGARILELTGMNPDMMIRLIGRVDYHKMCELGDVLVRITKDAKEVYIKSQSGTDLRFENDPSRPVFHNDGVLREKGIYKPLGGQISWAPIEDSIEGLIVVDTFIWPPTEIGVLRTPVKLFIKEGRIVNIEGGVEAKIFENWLKSIEDEKMYYVAHASWGFHPKARLTGIPLEDERLYAGIEFGFGSQSLKFRGRIGKAKSHTDVGLHNPNVYFDGVLVASEGRFVHEGLAELDKLVKK
ncbi:MAG: aminopeptidase [Nitrososphaeria archaeon]|nr:aminopeptidase [Nitrososphaeria archaeon]MDW7986242.1 aminopeptidase [Nitrososphaerota archaeon]